MYLCPLTLNLKKNSYTHIQLTLALPKKMYLIFDTETTGLPRRWDAPLTDSDNWPRAVQIAWQLHDEWGELIEHQDFLIKPDGFDVPYDAEKVHGISTQLAEAQGLPIAEVFKAFNEALSKAQYVVGQI